MLHYKINLSALVALSNTAAAVAQGCLLGESSNRFATTTTTCNNVPCHILDGCGSPSHLCDGGPRVCKTRPQDLKPLTLVCAGVVDAFTCGQNALPSFVAGGEFSEEMSRDTGAIYCHGGTDTLGQCNNIRMSLASCLICGSKNACKNVEWNGKFIPNDRVLVVGCSEDYVLDYMNTIHYDLSRVPFSDMSKSGFPDVVEAWCYARRRNDAAACIQEYSYSAANQQWTRVTATAATDPDAVDPDTLSDSGGNSDTGDKETRIIAAVVMSFLVVVMLTVLLCLGYKNKWIWCKNIMGRQSPQSQENPDALIDDATNQPKEASGASETTKKEDSSEEQDASKKEQDDIEDV